MKKLLGIVVLGLLCLGNAYADCKVGNCTNGTGTMTWPNGDQYVGGWKDTKTHGVGTMIWSDGTKYVGDWKNGKEDGIGTMTRSDNTKYVGDWKNGIATGLQVSIEDLWHAAAKYVLPSIFEDCDILTKKDPTSFQNISFVKETKITFWDGRKQTSSGWNQSTFKVFVFKATFKKGKDVSIRVNSEFKTKKKAEKQALKYGRMAGQLPNFLRTNLKTITVHKGNRLWGGGNYDILIHTGDDFPRKCMEEVMIHEGAHASLDWEWGGSLKKGLWKKAAKADGKFISKYAKEYPYREDVAETINWWIAVRCKPNKISKSTYKKIIEGIPNRLEYIDKQNYDLYPMVCK